MATGHPYEAPLERVFRQAARPFDEFIHGESTSGLLLISVTAIALFLANSPLAHTYEHVFHTPIAVSVGPWRLEHSLHHWINDGLMALFFFVVGLEIKREILVGELAEPRRAVMPIVAAIGGMVVPALFYAAMNLGGGDMDGWAIPMATDIAFAVGLMVLLGSRVPRALLAFLVALAIVDDLGGVAVIALFYTEEIVWQALAIAALLLALLVAFNLLGIRKPIPYFLVGAGLWLALLESGIHATLAGVLTAWTIPARPRFDPQSFSRHVRELMDRFDERCSGAATLMRNEEQRAIVQTLENGVHHVETPLQRLEHGLHLPVAFGVIPLFALANAGIPLALGDLRELLAEPVALGVMAGLLIGKPLGIAGFSLLAVRLGLGQLPTATRPVHIVGVGLLGGIGFTMSIFITELGFAGQPEQILLAKTGILAASLVAGIAGYLWLRLVPSPAPAGQA